jgi:hypothetical protein
VIFVDTGAWFAAAVPNDPEREHQFVAMRGFLVGCRGAP